MRTATIRKIAGCFGIDSSRMSKPRNAALAQVYVIDNRWILRGRTLSSTTQKNLRAELRLLQKVQTRLPYAFPSPLATKTGELFVIAEGYLWTLYERIPGRVLCTWFTLQKVRSTDIRRMLTSLRTMHERTRGIFPRSALLRSATFLTDIKEKFRMIHAHLPAHVRARIGHAIRAIGRVEKGSSSTDYCFVHGDFHHGNLVFGRNHRTVGVLDCDWSRVGLPWEDLAYTAMMYLRTYPAKMFHFNKRKLARMLQWYRLPSHLRPMLEEYLLLYAMYDVCIFTHARSLPRRNYFLAYQRSMLETLCREFATLPT